MLDTKKSAKVKLGENPKDPYGRKEEGQGKPNYFHRPACRWRARGGCLCFILGGKDRDLRLGLPGLSLAYPPTLILNNTIKKAVVLTPKNRPAIRIRAFFSAAENCAVCAGIPVWQVD